uniref:tRNA-intron lyase n=1 Tax=Arcella intermedia TaxID=1963864 RepID=A0A6B2LKH1_9EUKA
MKPLEPLQLAPEEVIYLMKELGHSFIIDGVLVAIEELWKKFEEVNRRFFGLYFVYSHYRKAGWVPKCGLKFGTDLVLYFQGPETSHSRYAVSIDIVTESGEALPYCPNPHRSWLSFMGMNRVCGNAIKELVTCVVVVPNGLSQENTFSASVLESLNLKHYSFGRWNANKEN